MSLTPVANQRVLIDQTGSAKLALMEDKAEKKLFAEGKIGQCDVPTANGRVYPRSVMEREINKLQEKINNGSLLGAVDHPGDGKCLGLGTPVVMADGRIVPVEQILRGDRIMGPDNQVRTVISTTTGFYSLPEASVTSRSRIFSALA